MDAIRVEVWSDIACPWCWVGKRHLEAAIRDVGERVEVIWRAFELDPAAPRVSPENVDYVGRLAAKYRTSRAEAQAMIDRMVEVGAAVGLELRFDRIRPGNTFDAHRLLAFSANLGAQEDLAERLFRAYLQEGRSLSDPHELADLAAEAGLDRPQVEELLAGDALSDAVRREEREAQALGATGVPLFVIDRRFAIPGAQPAELIARFLARARAEAEPPELDPSEAPACGPDQCDALGAAGRE